MSKEDLKKPLKAVLKGIIGKLDKSSQSSRLMVIWKDILGEKEQAYTRLTSFRKGRLVVNVSDSTRLYDLTLRRRDLIREINERLEGKKTTVKEIRFKIGDI